MHPFAGYEDGVAENGFSVPFCVGSLPFLSLVYLWYSYRYAGISKFRPHMAWWSCFRVVSRWWPETADRPQTFVCPSLNQYTSPTNRLTYRYSLFFSMYSLNSSFMFTYPSAVLWIIRLINRTIGPSNFSLWINRVLSSSIYSRTNS